MVAFGSVELGTIESDIRGGYRHQLMWERGGDPERGDMIWFARMLSGESRAGAGEREWAALLWCYAQRHAWRGSINDRFVAGIRSHSQPINPIWARGGLRCSPAEANPGRPNAGRGFGGPDCAEERLRNRERITNMSWEDVDISRRRILVQWARGEISNPIPKYIDFAMKGRPASSEHLVPGARTGDGFQVVPRGNAFYKMGTTARNTTENWPENYVRIVFDGNSSTEDTSTQSDEPSTPRSEPESDSPSRPESLVRERLITSDRRSPPEGSTFPYFTVSGSATDPQSSQPTIAQDSRVLRTNQERFKTQISGLKSATTLDYAQVVPVLRITTEGKDGIVDLNEMIFSKSPFFNVLNPSEREGSQGMFFDDLPERPIASLVSFQTKIESSTVGGPTSITIGTLSIKVHSPEKVHINHPRGRYISYMLRQGFSMRIRYGTTGPDNEKEFLKDAFQWKEEDFFVSQHDINIANDKTYDLNLTLLPATQKLFNQINIGESIPFRDEDGTQLQVTNQDIEQIIQNVTSERANENELSELRRRLTDFQHTFNQGVRSAGYRTVRHDDGQGGQVFGSVLHGAISQSRILDNSPNQQSVPIENSVDALRSIQSALLTRRFDTMLRRDAYMARIKNIDTAVINLGPLVYRMVKPEIDAVIRYTALNDLKVGEEFSSDRDVTERAPGVQPPRRTIVKMIFDNFNANAGRWANKPISMIPVNVNAVFRQLRSTRDVGEFSSTINAFISNVNRIINEPENFVIERSTEQTDPDKPEPEYRLDRPEIKYLLYPDPTDAAAWVMLFYDNKAPLIVFRNMMRNLERERGKNEPLRKSDVISKLSELGIPWLEIGENSSIIKSMTARTSGDDTIMSNNMIQANRESISVREADGSPSNLAGVSRSFLAGSQTDPQNVIRSTALILPVEVSLVSYIMNTAFLFTPIYVFFPTKMFEGLYLPYIIDHEVRDGFVQTRMTLQINITSANRSTN